MTEWLLLLARRAPHRRHRRLRRCGVLPRRPRPADRPERRSTTGTAMPAIVLQSLKQLSTQLSAAQVGITITTLVVGYLAQPSIGRLLAGPLSSARARTAGASRPSPAPSPSCSRPLLDGLRRAAPAVPRHLGPPRRRRRSSRCPSGSSRRSPGHSSSRSTAPPTRFLRAIGIEPQEELSGARTPQELASLVQRSAEAGTLEVTTARLLTRRSASVSAPLTTS